VKVSVIIPAYNASQTIAEALVSLQAQTFSQWEAIVVDDGASDEPGGEAAGGSKLGVTVVPITPDIAQQLGLRRGTQGVAVESVDPDGPAARARIQSGDVIQEVNRQPVRSAADIASHMSERDGDTGAGTARPRYSSY